MARKILGVIAGLLLGAVVMLAFESLDHSLYPPPGGVDPKDMAGFKDYVDRLPIGAFLLLMLGHAVGTFAGAVVATLVSGRASGRPGMVVGGIFLVGGLVMVMTIPHPVWFSLFDLLAYMPVASAAAWLLVRRPAVPVPRTP